MLILSSDTLLSRCATFPVYPLNLGYLCHKRTFNVTQGIYRFSMLYRALYLQPKQYHKKLKNSRYNAQTLLLDETKDKGPVINHMWRYSYDRDREFCLEEFRQRNFEPFEVLLLRNSGVKYFRSFKLRRTEKLSYGRFAAIAQKAFVSAFVMISRKRYQNAGKIFTISAFFAINNTKKKFFLSLISN